MASINDLAAAATIASSAVAMQSSTEEAAASQPASPSSSQDPSSPPSPSPSAQLQAQAREAHAQKIKSASKSPVSQTADQALEPELELEPESEVEVEVEPHRSPGAPDADQAATAAPSEPDSSKVSLTVNVAAVRGEQSTPETAEDAMDGVEYGMQHTPAPVRGAFIVFEGMDRAGKTTQAKLLQMRCIESGRQVKFMRFPGMSHIFVGFTHSFLGQIDRTTPIGQMIDSYLKGQSEIEDHVIHLLFSANRWEAAQRIKSELEAGHTIICDRFYHSGIVYSAAKQNASLSLAWAKAPEVGLPRPDLVLFLDLEESVARERGGWGGEIYEKGEMQRRVRDLFWGLSMGHLDNAASARKSEKKSSSTVAAADNGVGGGETADGGADGDFRQEREDIQIVDANLGMEELAEKVWEVVRSRLEAVERGDEGKTVRIVR
ncbi:thymidylate kinase-domain-containing protein [Xylariaceae sp. FL0594]|nr:thymidylate kinase-domain-containing protein [Xylariaceae sp. FL0594]